MSRIHLTAVRLTACRSSLVPLNARVGHSEIIIICGIVWDTYPQPHTGEFSSFHLCCSVYYTRRMIFEREKIGKKKKRSSTSRRRRRRRNGEKRWEISSPAALYCRHRCADAAAAADTRKWFTTKSNTYGLARRLVVGEKYDNGANFSREKIIETSGHKTRNTKMM